MVDLVDCSSQGIHVVLHCLVSHISFHVTFVYGLHTIVARRDLWVSLRRWCPASPWMILGDFNSILSQDDKLNESVVSAYEITDFHKCHLDLGLCDLPYTGCHYTWSNGSIWSKIDRVLVNPLWSSLHQSAHVHFGNQGAFSKHSFATIRLNPQDKGHHSFKFLNMWSTHADFSSTVSAGWNMEISRSAMYAFCKRLKLLKVPLKRLNEQHFSHISERVSRAEMDLDIL
ncbi:hypothetical protein OIU76_002023 [Salix suchowensis]|nr:hypothetical protein OIU76_002023 [Salix suchowensis]